MSSPFLVFTQKILMYEMLFFRVIACQLAIKDMFRNMSLLKTEEPGLLPSVVWIPALIACIAMDSASSTNSFAVVMFCGGSLCNRVLRTLPTVCCICLLIALLLK